MTDNQRKFTERPTMDEVVNTFFKAHDGSFVISAQQADHALAHYDESVAKADAHEEPQAARNGLMGACLAHALGWTLEEGLDKIRTSSSFQFLIWLMQETYIECKAAGLFDSPEAKLS
jgi:hypothetical protein